MSYTIVLAKMCQIEQIMPLYCNAREFMARNGNANQWINGYPTQDLIEKEILDKKMYLCLNQDNVVLAAFSFVVANDSTYDVIYKGQWLNSEPYGVVHRLVSSGVVSRIGDVCMEWCFAQHANIRVDTHHDNMVMQNLLYRLGYVKCGEIKIANGSVRVAFHKTNL
ncbi:MAG: GNAT family N-acetyltransferase [Rikenellaceae bacterium]